MTKLYAYLKKPVRVKKVRPPIKKHKWVSFMLLFFGIGLLSSVTWPMAKWWLSDLPRQPKTKFVSPVVATESAGLELQTVSSWYPTAKNTGKDSHIQAYTISIPKLRIASALVSLENDDLKKSLVGWKTGGIPGQNGTAIIFGHSALPQFYDPKNYLTIFSLLPNLKKGDQVFVTYDGVFYKYNVIDMQTVDPDDFSALEQKFDDSYITLITCVPPGTYWKRLVVRGRVVSY